MSNNEESRTDVIDRLVEHVLERLPHHEAPLVKRFIHQYYLSVSPEDLTAKGILDLYGAVLSHWHYLAERKKGEIKVRVYNPQLEQHGWQSTHTVIEIAFDDMPFLVDSVSMELHRMGLNIHLIIHLGSIRLKRDENDKVIEVLDYHDKDDDVLPEAAIYIEIDRQSDPEMLEKIEQRLRDILNDVRTVVDSWPAMRLEAEKTLEEIKAYESFADKEELKETIAFLQWLIDDHFTFMGYIAYRLENEGDKAVLYKMEGSELGLPEPSPSHITVNKLGETAQKLIFSKELLIAGKTNVRSTVHRPAYMDFVAIKWLDQNGQFIGEKRFTGLYTAVAYNNSPRQIPYLRSKVSQVLKQAGFLPRSHDDRALLNILETLPRDDLFQATVPELLDLSTGILHLQERQKIRLFIRRNIFGCFFSCLVYVPRDTYNSTLREKFQTILMEGLKGKEVEFTTRFSESSLARIHFGIRVDPTEKVAYDVKTLEKKLVEAGRTWGEDLNKALIEQDGEENGNELYKRYGAGFPAGYQETFLPRVAVVDIDYFESLSDAKPLGMSLYRNIEDSEETVRFKLFRMNFTIPLSDVVPILENMGLKIISERPYAINLKEERSIWINDYRMVRPKGKFIDIEAVRDIFQDAFDNIWHGQVENDSFNRLVLEAQLNWREIMILRAYAKYLWQTGFTFSQNFIEDALVLNSGIASELIKLFKMRFDPDVQKMEQELLIQKKFIEELLENVASLSEDRVLRRYLDMIFATVRTNYYQLTEEHKPKAYFSFKVESKKIPELPLPLPLYEIFVYSPRVEAIHLRAAKVARGGIRWSDRKEDFRTEILELMKTQQVKNAVIVPMGAKGGFIVKKSLEEATREEINEEVIYCYQTLMRGLLDITDNLKKDTVVSPQRVVRYDEDDPYLVVAADKGTASFSDIANGISKNYEFWLGDAFASGGSTGYDHKKMGITARGAWESVKRHFMEMDVDIQQSDFTVIGIGDMAGDVFGNGMLLSRHIKLVAAFNHQHIFIDPTPDPEISFKERERLFNLPGSKWSDYNPELISKGGGVYPRSAKSITITKEVKEILGLDMDRVVPNELIRAILKAPVDLLWNGGIGTYVKSADETNAMVGDRANDALRVNGRELRCSVVGEGGNLGFTQLGRIEYAKLGGRLNTDAIDNSGGVNCSDNEVNIKILLHDVVEAGDLTEKQRNELLVVMQEEVADLVLTNNKRQTEAISITLSQAVDNLEMHSRLIQEMEKSGNLNRSLECLPDAEEIATRKLNKQGLTRPEVAVLMAYTKILLKQALLKSDVADDHYMMRALEHAFPSEINKDFHEAMERHPLRREIIATRVSNTVINEMGISFIYRLKDETGGHEPDIVRAYSIAREIFEAGALRGEIHQLTGLIEASIQLKMIQEVNRLVRRGTRWFLRNRATHLSIVDTIHHFKPYIKTVADILPGLLQGKNEEMDVLINTLLEAKVPEKLALKIGCLTAMFSALDIVESALTNGLTVEQVTTVYYVLGRKLHLDWFREAIKKHPISNHWEALARGTYRDDLDRLQGNLTISILKMNGEKFKTIDSLIEHWLKRHTLLVERWEGFITELKNTSEVDFTMFSVALRELMDLSQVNHRNHTHQK